MEVPREWKKKTLRQRNIEGTEVTSIMSVPNTAGGELINRLIQKEAQLSRISGYRVKLVEGNGIPINKFFPSPLAKKRCHRREKCIICCQAGDKLSKCSVRNVVYIAQCMECSNKQDCKQSVYIGETSRSLFERSVEHINGSLRMDASNFITKHWLAAHRNDECPPIFKFAVEKIHRDAMSRQLHEAVRISAESGQSVILNSKCEWNANSLPRLVVEKSTLDIKKQANDLIKKEEMEKACVTEFKNSKKKVSFQMALNKLRNHGNKQLNTQSKVSCVENPVETSKNDMCCNLTVNRQSPHLLSLSLDFSRSSKRQCGVEELLKKGAKRARMERLINGNIGLALDKAGARIVHTSNTVPVNLGIANGINREGCNLMPEARVDSFSQLQNFGHRSNVIRECDGGLLWSLRSRLGDELEFKDTWSGISTLEDSVQTLSQSVLDEVCDLDEYSGGSLSSQDQDEIVRSFSRLNVGLKEIEPDNMKSLDAPLDPSIWRFVLLLSSKIDEKSIENIFMERNNTPTVNTLANMLKNNHLRTPLDFEIALNRQLSGQVINGREIPGQDRSQNLKYEVLDRIGGLGTTANTIHELKVLGSYHGVKRRLRYGGANVQSKWSRPVKFFKMCESGVVVHSSRESDENSKTSVLDGVNLTAKSPVKLVSHILKEQVVTAGRIKRKLGSKYSMKCNGTGKYNSRSIHSPKSSCGVPGTPGSKQGTVLGFVVRTPRKEVVGALPLDGTGRSERAALVEDKPDADS